MKARIGCFALLAAALLCSPAAAEGWGLPNLNPFAKKPGPPTSARGGDSGGFSLMPNWGSSKKRSSGPSTWSRMTSGTTSFLSKTADAINPFDDANDSKAGRSEPSPTGSFNPFSTASSKKSSNEKKSFLPSWATGESEAPKKPRSVNEFLSQPSPTIP